MKEIMSRFLYWVEKNGGPIQVAKVINKSPQTFYNYINRGSMPNMEILALLSKSFADFDSGYILTGNKSDGVESEELKKLRRDIKIREATIEKLININFKPDAVNPQQEILGDPYKWTIKSAIMQGVPVADQKNMSSQWFPSPIC